MYMLRSTSNHPDFQSLVRALDAELVILDGDDHDFYHQYNGIEAIKHAITLYDRGIPIACGAIKSYDDIRMEVKRMYVLPDHRGKGMATKILRELERWTAELGYTACILETGKSLTGAVRLYEKNAYRIISNFGQYVGVDNSICFEKDLNPLFTKA